MRVLSLLPSATETVCALGEGGSLVGRSAECDFPSSVRSLPAVMRPKVDDFERPSLEIDARVQAVRGRGESLYTLDIEQLRSLRPDLIITQDLCSVCSVTETEVAAACRDAGLEPVVLSLSPRNLEEVAQSFEAIARALGIPERGRDLASRLRGTAAPPLADPRAPRVAVVEWLDPPILAGLWVPEMIAGAGGRALGPDPGTPGHRTTWPLIEAQRPDLVILSPCSFGVRRIRTELADDRLARAVGRLAPSRGVWLADEAHFSRPGPRLSEGVRLLSSLLQGRGVQSELTNERWRTAEAPA